MENKHADLVSAAKRVLQGNRHAGKSQWENRSFDFVCPSNVTYPFQWLWDSCFHAIALSHIDVKLAEQELLCLLQAAQPDGFIPHMILWEREKYIEQVRYYSIALMTDYLTAISQPPVLAQAVERVFRLGQNKAFLEAVLPKVKSYYRWWMQNRDPDNDNLIAIIQPDESGLDALPSYDALLKMPTTDIAGLRQAMQRIFSAYAPLRNDPAALLAADVFVVEDLLTNCAYAQGLRALARLCRINAELDDAMEFDQLGARVEQALVNKCYDERRGIFFDLLGAAEKPSGVVTVTCLLPLMLDHLDSAICKRLVDEHLHNPAEFWLPYPVPSVAANEPSFDPEARTGLLWRGSTWVNMNWFLVGGLRQHGYTELADELVERTCAMISNGGFREYYSPYSGIGYGAPGFGWTTLVLDFLLPSG
ncbi:MAG TPA: trehalase family glycosidase [Anaerolineae bacterium]